MLQIVDNLNEEIKRVESQLEEMVKENEDVELLMIVPGIGINTAETIAAYKENLERFEGNCKRFCILHRDRAQHPQIQRNKTPRKDHEAWASVIAYSVCPAAIDMVRLTKVTFEWWTIKNCHRKKDNKGSVLVIIALSRKISRMASSCFQRWNPPIPI